MLLALTPLVAGLLLFKATRGLFSGWLKGLVLTMLGSVGTTIVLAAELALLEPLLQDALRLRDLGYATPATPTELTTLTAGFALALFGILALLAKVAFQPGWPSMMTVPMAWTGRTTSDRQPEPVTRPVLLPEPPPSRAFLISERMSQTVRQEELNRGVSGRISSSPGSTSSTQVLDVSGSPNAGSAPRRLTHRPSTAAARRDARS
jgi:type IV secretion system protein VirB6